MKLLVPTLLLYGASSIVLAAPPKTDPSGGRANQTIDAQVFRIFYMAPQEGAEVQSPVQFEVKITDTFQVDRELACSPAGACYGKEPQFRLDDTGHCHTYIENMALPGTPTAFTAACEPKFEIDLKPGHYCAYADLTHNDHVARYKPGPQDLPAFDKVCFTVSP